jgi:cardiolipin synthase A/B
MPPARKTKRETPTATVSERLIVAPDQRRPAVLDAIALANRRIVLSMFRCTDFEVMDALADALGRKVKVELLLTQRAKGWEKKIRDLGLYLESMGARVHRYSLPRVKYHAKYVLIDDAPALVASLNFTRKCFENTGDFLLFTHDEAIASGLARLFEHDVTSPGLPLPGDIPGRLIVGPDRARAQFRDVILGARESLRIVDHKVTDPEMVQLLREREAAGVSVEIFGKGSFDGLKSHGKMMLVDNARAVVGSISLSPPSLDDRREVAILTEDGQCVAQLAEFLKRAENGRSPATIVPAAPEDAASDDNEEEESDS